MEIGLLLTFEKPRQDNVLLSIRRTSVFVMSRQVSNGLVKVLDVTVNSDKFDQMSKERHEYPDKNRGRGEKIASDAESSSDRATRDIQVHSMMS